jgi:hypothetical protein
VCGITAGRIGSSRPAAGTLTRVGPAVLRLIVGHLVPVGAPLAVAIDDTLFRRTGRKVHASHWAHDGSLAWAQAAV